MRILNIVEPYTLTRSWNTPNEKILYIIAHHYVLYYVGNCYRCKVSFASLLKRKALQLLILKET